MIDRTVRPHPAPSAMRTPLSGPRRGAAVMCVATLLLLTTVAPALAGPRARLGAESNAEDEAGHLVVSEVMTGGGSASDEFVEIYNPTLLPLPLEGLELIYVTASGTTLTRRA
ncbi:MAG TPA: hypothetical protein VHK06_05535, partial [Candidatus Limnocylindria bacterium]|nr:hypothetical protein [Candidatus Limnocylindria bacterium]